MKIQHGTKIFGDPPTCSGSGDPVQNMTFDGKWDQPSSGIEQMLQEEMCPAIRSRGL